MPRYEITGPDGHRYEVTAPEGATEQEVLEHVVAEAKKRPAVPVASKSMEPLKALDAEDRRWLNEHLPGEPGYNEAREEMATKYGGEKRLRWLYDPAGEIIGKYVVPTALSVAGLAAGPAGMGAEMAAGGAELATVAGPRIVSEALKYLLRGGPLAGYGAYEAGKRIYEAVAGSK